MEKEYKIPGEADMFLVSEPQETNYEKAEIDQLKEALMRSYKERFLMMTTLMKMNDMFRRAKITHTPYTLNK